MAKHCMFPLLFAAQMIGTSGAVVRQADFRAEPSLRVQSNYSTFSLSQSIWNSTVFNLVRREVEVQQPFEVQQPSRPKVNKVIWVLLTCFFGMCGCDRCFMGQICAGVVKGCTLGGFFVWYFIDYFVCIVNSLNKGQEIRSFGYDAAFEPRTIDGAFWIALVHLIWTVFQNVSQFRAASQQRELQARQQAELAAEMSARNSTKATDGEDDKGLDIPRRHQSLPYLPTVLTKGLRKAGLVQEKPTIPELVASFDAMDKNGDGQLDHEEIKTAMAAMGVSDEMVDSMIKDADVDGDGKISKNEFLMNMTQKDDK